jgi:hypothetical protein
MNEYSRFKKQSKDIIATIRKEILKMDIGRLLVPEEHALVLNTLPLFLQLIQISPDIEATPDGICSRLLEIFGLSDEILRRL